MGVTTRSRSRLRRHDFLDDSAQDFAILDCAVEPAPTPELLASAHVRRLVNTPARRRGKSVSMSTWATLGTLCFEDTPDYLRDNAFLRAYFRPELSFSGALRSVFSWHNETGNIWTHLLGFLLLLYITAQFAMEPYPQAAGSSPAGLVYHPPAAGCPANARSASSWQASHIGNSSTPASSGASDMHVTVAGGFAAQLPWSSAQTAPKWPLFVVLYGYMQVLLVSATCHTFCCMSKRVNTWIWKADYLAISCAIASMFVPWCWYCFACCPPWVKLGFIASTSCIAACIMAVSLLPVFQSPKLHAVRPVLFALLAGWGLAPMAYAGVLFWREHCAVRWAIGLTLLQMGMNLVGATFFVTRFPERRWPGRFDLVGSSHQLFHTMIVAVFLVYIEACLTLWRWRATLGPCSTGLA